MSQFGVPFLRKTVAAAFVLGLVGCAQTEAPEAGASDSLLAQLDTSRACFTQREITGYSNAPGGSAGRERIFVNTGRRERFLLETTGPCPDLDFSLRIALDTRTMGSICTGDFERLIVPSVVPQDFGVCPVRVLGRVPRE